MVTMSIARGNASKGVPTERTETIRDVLQRTSGIEATRASDALKKAQMKTGDPTKDMVNALNFIVVAQCCDAFSVTRNAVPVIHAQNHNFSLELTDRCIEPLINCLSHESPAIRAEAAGTLGCAGSPHATLPLVKALEGDPNPEVRKAAAGALSAIADTVSEKNNEKGAKLLVNAVSPLICALEDPKLNVRIAAAGALGAICEPAILCAPHSHAEKILANACAEQALGPLLNLTKTSKNRKVRDEAADALGKVAACALPKMDDVKGPKLLKEIVETLKRIIVADELKAEASNNPASNEPVWAMEDLDVNDWDLLKTDADYLQHFRNFKRDALHWLAVFET